MPHNIVPRVFRQRSPDLEDRRPTEGPLSAFDEHRVVVVLGAPGIGKTTQLKQAAEAEGAQYLTVERFLVSSSWQRWRGMSLYLDGLDEYRVKQGDTVAVMAQIADRLECLEPSKVRLSCRTADWLGGIDLEKMEWIGVGQPAVIDLLPLDRGSILAVMADALGEERAKSLLEEAGQRQMAELLTNPQTLTMIISVVARDGGWPEGKRNLYQRTTELLIKEHQEGHRRANALAREEDVIVSADHLAACMLLGGQEVLALSEEAADDACPTFTVLQDDIARLAARRRIFPAEGVERIGLPHRTVAEFMAARHLARRILEGLPAARVLALICGYDGAPVAALRGVFGWLISLLPTQSAIPLIERDPVGVLVHGDASDWPEALRVTAFEALKRLARHDPYFLASSTQDKIFAPLACSALELPLREVLRQCEPTHLPIVGLAAIEYGAAMPALAGDLLLMMRNNSCPEHLRARAIDAFANAVPDRLVDLIAILEDLTYGRIADPHDEIRVTLFRILYPRMLGPADLVRALQGGGQKRLGSMASFIGYRLPSLIPTGHLTLFLDAVADLDKTWASKERSSAEALAKIILRALEETPSTGADRLVSWLMLLDGPHLKGETTDGIHRYIATRSGLWIEMLREWILKECTDGRLRIWKFKRLIGFNAWPAGAARSLMTLAAELAPEPVATELAQFAFDLAARAEPPEPSFDDIAHWTEEHPQLEAALEQWRYWLLPPGWREHVNYARASEAAARESRKLLIKQVKENAERVAAGRHLRLLDRFADIWQWGNSSESDGLSLRQRLIDQSDEACADMVMRGFVAALHHDDLPSPGDCGALSARAGAYRIANVLRCGMDVIDMEGGDDIAAVPPAAAALCWCLEQVAGRPARDAARINWPEAVRERYPDQVVRAAEQWWHGYLHADATACPNGLYGTTWFHPNESVLTALAASLLRDYPHGHPRMLHALLGVLIAHGDAIEIVQLTTRPDLDRMAVEQAAVWRTAAALANPEGHVRDYCAFVAGSEDAKWNAFHAAEALIGRVAAPASGPAHRLLLEAFLSHFENVPVPFGSRTVGPRDPEDAAVTLRRVVENVAQDPAPEAGELLHRLRQDPHTASWHPLLLHCAARQAATRRQATFRAPDLDGVAEALRGGAPASPADLRALVVDTLGTLQEDYRNGAMDGWKGFWNRDSNGRVTKPLVEEECRNVLAQRLADRLQVFGISVDREVQVAGHKRPDIQVRAASGGKVPIEAKRQTHDELWVAAETQLDAQYCRDPETDGQGIYLVFWFGQLSDFRIRKPPGEESRPGCSEELQSALEARLNEDQRPRISVLVLDVSPPVTVR